MHSELASFKIKLFIHYKQWFLLSQSKQFVISSAHDKQAFISLSI